jgi:hypothetical protein
MTAPPRVIHYPASWRIKSTIFGQIQGQPWNTAVWWSTTATGIPDTADLVAQGVAMGSNFATVRTQWSQINCSTTSIDSCRLDVYAPSSGAVVASGSTTSGFDSSGAAPQASAASQCLVTSPKSAHPGRSGRGRMYWPATAALPISPNLYSYSLTRIQDFCNAVAGWLTAVNSFGGTTTVGDMQACVQSLTVGELYLITSMKIDGRPDRMEHREKRIVFPRYEKVV